MFIKDECDNDYESLVLRLRMQNNRMYLIGTQSKENSPDPRDG